MEKMIEFQVKYKGKTYNLIAARRFTYLILLPATGLQQHTTKELCLIISSWFVSVTSKTTIRHRSVILRTLSQRIGTK